MVRENLKLFQKIPRKTSRGVAAGRYNSFYLLLRVFFDLLPMVTIGRTI